MGTRMRTRRPGAAVLALVLSSLALAAASGVSRPERPAAVRGDVEALALYRSMHAAIRDARTLAYESEYVRETDGRELGRSGYRMILRKPNLARLESRSEDGTRTGVLVLDGRRMWIFWPDGRPYIHESDSIANMQDGRRSYIRKDAPRGAHSIARETSVLGTGMSMTVLDPSIFHGSRDLMDDLLESVRGAGSINVDGEVCDIVVASYLEGRRTREFWISRRDRLPRRLEETMRGKRDIVVRERWRNVVVNGAVAKDRFKWNPPPGWEEYRLQALGDGLLKPGSKAPDFDLPLLDGTRFRLSEHRGKVVWLSFWRLSCVPCRRELPHLQSLQDRYAGEGLIVVGFNCADGKEPAEEFIREKMIRFPNVVDTTAAARDVLHAAYQTSKGQGALPLNYIIDINGTIAGGWYGFDKGSDTGERILRALGIVK